MHFELDSLFIKLWCETYGNVVVLQAIFSFHGKLSRAVMNVTKKMASKLVLFTK